MAAVVSGEGGVLEFEAKLAGVKPVIAKVSEYGQTSPGRLEMTLAIEQPSPPRSPRIPYEFDRHGGGWKDRPEDLKGKAADDEAKAAARKAEQERYDAARARWDQEMKDFGAQQAGYQSRLVAYAQLVGISAVFEQQVLAVRMSPLQDVLPGFGVSLLPAPAPADEPVQEEPGWGDEDDEDED